MSFKKKSNKIKYTTNIVTLDELHHNKINDYVKQNELIPEKKKELRKLKKQMKELNLKKIISSSDEIIEKSILKESIENLENEIRNIQRNTDILDYTDKTINLLVDYYALSNKDKNENENKDDIIDISNMNKNEKKSVENKLVQINLLSQKSRKIRRPVQTRKIQQIQPTNNLMSKFLGEIDENVTAPESKINKKQLQEKYLIVTDKNYACEKVMQTQSVPCQFCKIDKTLFRSEGRYTCLTCG